MSLFTSNFKKFIIFFGFSFFLLFFATIFLIELDLSKNKKSNLNQNHLLINGHSPYAAFGDSHADRAFKSSFKLDNLSNPGDNINMIAQKVIYRITENKNFLKGVILQADPHMFSFYRLTSVQRLGLENKRHLFNFLLERNKRYLMEYSKKVWLDLFFFFIKNNNLQTKLLGDSLKKNWVKNAMLRVHLHAPVNNFSEQKAAKKYIDIIKILKKKSIKVCMITFPVSKSYNNFTKKIKNFDNVKIFFKKIAETNNLKYFDLTNALNESQFSDPDHIKKEFSNIFSKTVFRKCNF